MHPSVDGCLGDFRDLPIVNSAVNTGVCVYLFKLEFSSFLDIYPGVVLMNHRSLFLVFFCLFVLRNPMLLCIFPVPICIPMKRKGGFLFP